MCWKYRSYVVLTDGNTLDKYISNKTHNKNIKNIHALGTFTNPGIHTLPSYVACDIDARTACIVTRYNIPNLPYSMAVSKYIYTGKYPAVQDHMHCTPMRMLISVAQCKYHRI